jgi:DnaJ-class molecular chaperone
MHISLLLVLFSLLSPSSQARSANLYIALGLNTSYVNEKELKRAFRTRAIETHPDKFTNKKNNHKNINREEDFQLVSESYTMLKNKVKSQDSKTFIHKSLFEIYTKGPNVASKVQRTTKVPCRACLGTGGKGGLHVPTVCSTCRGLGRSMQTWGCGPGQPCIQMSGACRTCGGSGWLGQLCQVCRGQGIVTEQREYNVEFPTGSMNAHTLRAVGEGDVDTKFKRPGDLLFQLNIKPHPLYTLQDNSTDLKVIMESTVEKLRSSFPLQLEKIGGGRQGYVNVNIPSYPELKAGEIRTVKIKDFHDFGDLIVEMKAKEEIWIFNTD